MAALLAWPSRARWILLWSALLVGFLTYSLYFAHPSRANWSYPAVKDSISTHLFSSSSLPKNDFSSQYQSPTLSQHDSPVPSQHDTSGSSQHDNSQHHNPSPQETTTQSPPSHPTSSHSSHASKKPKWGPPKAGEIVLVSGSAGTKGFQSIPDIKNMVYENRMAYCLRHGYDHMWANISSYSREGVPVYWNKIPVLKDAFKRYPKAEWLWWLDLDIILMNQSLDLWSHLLSPEGMARQLLIDTPIERPGGQLSGVNTPSHSDPDNIDFLISAGGWGMNVGSFLMRRGDWSDWLLDMWDDPLHIQQNWIFPENDAWTHMFNEHQIVRDRTGCTNQRALDAFPEYNQLGVHYQDGDLLVHFAGCGNHTQCPSHWNEYWNKRHDDIVPEIVRQKLADGTAEIENVQGDS